MRRRKPTTDDLVRRIEDLEAFSHQPIDFTHLIAKIDRLEREVRRLKRVKK